MTDEISNKTVIITLVLAIVVSLGGSIAVISKLGSLAKYPQVTGFAADDTGQVEIEIGAVQSIEINSTHNLIDFGTCTVPSQATGSEDISSEMTEAEINATVGNVDCQGTQNGDGGSFPAYIRIENLGNVRVNISVESNVTGAKLLNSTGATMRFRGGDPDSDCKGTLTDTWTAFAAADTQYDICTQLEKGAYHPAVNISINMTIPWDASTPTGGQVAKLTFWADGTA